jgi:L-ascorbate metabolism protein UlaG (beta-lactamase superfamily)
MQRLIALIGALSAFMAFPAQAQKTAPDRCLALAWNIPAVQSPVRKAQVRPAALKPYQVRVTYHGHSTFTIESAKGVTVSTDYNDYVRPTNTPTIATMNVAHDTHYSNVPDEKIVHILKGWNSSGEAAAIHDLTVQDLRVRNVPTNIRNSFAGPAGGRYGNSIFIFESGGLCIAHLGHLHHTLTTQQLAQIGQMDVVFVPIDGSYTLDMPGTFEVLKSMRAPIVIPMHWFSGFSLDAFVAAAKADYEIVRNPTSSIIISKDKIPSKPRMLVMPPGG